jgi:uncharacterized membrane protein
LAPPLEDERRRRGEEGRVIRFSAPWLLAVGLPLVAILLWRLRYLPPEHGGLRRRAIQACILLATLAAALALAGLELGAPIDRLAVVFAVDRSRSVERAGEAGATRALERVRDSVATMEVDDRAGLVVFGAEAATEVVPSPSPELGGARASVPRDATDIGAAIRRALADLPAEHAGRIVLVSDGVETEGDALAAAASAASRGVEIDVLPIEREPSPEIAVDRVRIPETADPGEPIELRVVTRATRATAARVRVTRDGELLAETETEIREGDDVLVMRDIAPEAGVHRYDVLVEPIETAADGSRENNEGGAFVRVSGRSRALVLSKEPAFATALVEAMRATGLDVDAGGPARVPADLATLAGYDLLVLSDLNSRAFTEDQMAMVQSYVRDLGGGLLMLGGRDAFGLGGYAYTPIEEALPATFDLRQRRDRASLAMIIAIDNSGSMSVEVSPGRTKLDLANEAAARSAQLLSPSDRAGVMHVDTAVHWTLPMTSVTNPDAIADAIRRAQPGGGGILVDITLTASYQALGRESTQLKHLLLFSDGQDSENLAGTRAQVDAAVRDGITTSIVSMGSGVDTPELERLASIGQGRFYIVENMTELPRIFTQETIEASRSAIVEETFRASVGVPGAATRGLDFGAAPALGGYVVVNARPRASVLLGAKDDDPLLLTWQHGIGRSAVFATDGGSNFGRDWLAWDGYRALFGQLARDIARAPERRDARVAMRIEGGQGRVVVEAVDAEGRYRNYLDLGATVAAPGGRRIDVELSQTGAGRYEGTFDASTPGPYLVTVRERGEGLVGSAGAVRPSGDELRGEGTDHAKLAQIAALTGGRVRTDLRAVFTDRPPDQYSYRPAWTFLVMLAMCLMLLSVALRRLVLPADALRRLVPERVRRALRIRGPRAQRGADPTATLGALARAKEKSAAATTAREAPERPVAAEIAAAKAAAPARERAPEPAATSKAEASAEPAPTEPPPTTAAPPASLAETLLSRKKKR